MKKIFCNILKKVKLEIEILKRIAPNVKNILENSSTITITILAIIVIVSCSTSNDTTEPEPQNNAPTVTLTNVVSNDDTNTVSGKLTATDSDGTITQKTLKGEATDGTQVNIALNADGTFSHTFTNSGKVFNALIANVKDDDGAPTEITKNLTPVVEVEPPLNLDISIAVNKANVNEGESIKDIVFATINNTNNTAGVSYEVTQGGDYFTTVDNKVVGKDTQFDYETLQKIAVEVTAKASGQPDVIKTFNIDINDENEAPEHVDMEDVTYIQTSLGNTTATEDLSYTSTNSTNGVSVEVEIDEADNDPNNPNKVKYLLDGFDANNQPIYVPKADKVAEVLAASLGDATQLNVANTYANDGYGIGEFTRIDTTENGVSGTTLINKHGETVSLFGYVKGIQIILDDLGISNNGIFSVPNEAPNTGNNTVENWRIARAYIIEFGKKMQQTGATEQNTVAGWAAQTLSRVKNMSDAQLRNLASTVTPESWLVNYWD